MGRGQRQTSAVISGVGTTLREPELVSQTPLQEALMKAQENELGYLKPLLRELSHRYGQPQLGRHRAIFDTQDGYVLKVPIREDGFMANRKEANWQSTRVPLAACALRNISIGSTEAEILRMEKVEPLAFSSYKEVPAWVMRVDGGQVGYNAARELVAYDL
jgi:hypothetical protein